MAKYEDLVQKVAIHLSPCPEQAIIDAIRVTARDFCKETLVWVYDVPEITAVPDQLSYALDVPELSNVVRIWGVDGRTGSYTDDKTYYLTHPNIINFNDKPKRDSLKPIVSLMPSAASDEIPDFIVEYFETHIVSGAVAHLQMQPFRDWSEPNAAQAHLFKYQVGLQDAKNMRDNGLGLSKVKGRVKPQYI